jgi:hypothetical protein
VECVCPATCSWGINILTLDCRGFGESGGDRFDKLPQEKAAQVIGEKWPGDIDHQLLEKCQTLAASRIGRNSRFRFKNKLMSLDATVIDRCASVFDWAQFRRTKGAVKLHLRLDHNGHLPAFAVVTEGKKHEIQVAQWSFVSEARGSPWRYSD